MDIQSMQNGKTSFWKGTCSNGVVVVETTRLWRQQPSAGTLPFCHASQDSIITTIDRFNVYIIYSYSTVYIRTTNIPSLYRARQQCSLFFSVIVEFRLLYIDYSRRKSNDRAAPVFHLMRMWFSIVGKGPWSTEAQVWQMLRSETRSFCDHLKCVSLQVP